MPQPVTDPPVIHPLLRLPATLLALLCAALCALAACGAQAGATPTLSWSAPAEVDGGHALHAVSCPSLGFCAAVDDAGRVVLSRHPQSTAPGSWSVLAIDGSRSLSSISCPSSTLCVAVDSEGRAVVSTNPTAPGAWTAVAIDGTTALRSVSCPSAALCLAADSEGRVLFNTNPATAPGAWSSPLALARTLVSVSCASTTLCAAIDGEGRVLLSTAPAGGGWVARTIDPSGSLTAVSCYAAACVAVNGGGSAFASADPAATLGSGTAPGSGATWSATAFDAFGAPQALGCSAIGLCVAGDATGYAFASDTPAIAPPGWTAAAIDAQPPRALEDVSCSAEGLCAAVDASGRVMTAVVPAPTATSGQAGEVSHTTALLTGAVNPDDAALSSCRFEYGLGAEYGSSVPCANVPTGSGAAPVVAVLAGLTPNTTYHYRLLAASATGSGVGADETFETLAPGVVEPHPSISGTPAPGQRLTCRSGIGASTPEPTLSYAWLRDTKAIGGATAATYTVSSADVSRHLQCRVTATTAEGSRSATSAFVTVPAGGLGTISETTVGAVRVGRGSVSVPVRCSPQAAGACTIKLGLTVSETLRGSRVVAVSAARARRVSAIVGARTSRLRPAQQATLTVALNASGRRLLARRHRLPVRVSVRGTVVGALNAALKSATVTLSSSGKAAARGAAVGQALFASTARSVSHTPAVPPSFPPRTHIRARSAARVRARAASLLAAKPYMGWDSYFTFGVHFDEPAVLEQASQLLTRGLARRGYRYVWLDVGWWQGARSASGAIEVSAKQWPHGIAWLASTLHASGLKLGLYTDAGSEGCGGPRQGSYGHYQQDVDTFAAWGVDAVKVDFCGGIRQGLQPAAAYAAFHEAIAHNSSHRPMLLSICDFLQPGQFSSEVPALENSAFTSYAFGPSIGNSWRTDTDIGVPGSVQFGSVLRNLDADAAQPQAAAPGHWNDPDYLGPDQGMSAAQFRTQLSMWAMLAAPLMVSADLISLSHASLTTLTNREAVAIDQDPAGLQARLLSAEGDAQVWVKPLADGSRAVALLNRGSGSVRVSTTTSAIGMAPAGSYTLRNVWSGAGSRLGAGRAVAASVPAYSTVLVRVAPR